MRHRMPVGVASCSLLNSAAIAALLIVHCGSPLAADDFYAGKQVTFIVGAGVGGGYDLQARVTARHLGKHIPGKPAIIVQNMPARIAAANHMFNTAAKDGTTIALIQRGMLLAKLIYPAGTRFEIEKFNWLGSLNSETAVTLAWHAAPHKTAKDLFDQELIVGGITGVDPETTPRLYNSLIGTRFKVVTGYNSTAQIALAIERGEVQGIGDWSWSSVKAVRPDWVRDKKVTLLMQGALHKEPELGNLPSAFDYIKNDADRKVLELHFTQKTGRAAGYCAARCSGGQGCHLAQGVCGARARQGVRGRGGEEQDRVWLRFRSGGRQGRRAHCLDAARYCRALCKGVRACANPVRPLFWSATLSDWWIVFVFTHIGRRAASQEILAWRGEDIDHFGVLGKPRLVLDAARDHRDVAGATHAPLAAEAEFHAAL